MHNAGPHSGNKKVYAMLARSKLLRKVMSSQPPLASLLRGNRPCFGLLRASLCHDSVNANQTR